MTKVSRYALLAFLFLAASFLSAEVWMQAIRHTSFCTTSSCDVVGEYVRFGEGNLIKMGATAFWFLWALCDVTTITTLVPLPLLVPMRAEGNVLAFQPVRVALAVAALVVLVRPPW